MTCELYSLKISYSKCGELIISKSQVGLGDIVDVFEKYGKKNFELGGKHPPWGLGLKINSSFSAWKEIKIGVP